MESTLKIDGMHCQGCVSSVTKKLSEINGVSEVNVSLDDACAVVRYDDKTVNVNSLVDAVENAGFDCYVAP
jgi:copper chaperone